MLYSQWTQAMSVGVPALDADHRSLFRIIRVLGDIKGRRDLDGTVAGVLETLELYGQTHFRREEKVMAAIGFPGAAFHHSEHQGFARYIHSLRASARSEADSGLAATLFDYLTVWLQHHILIQDMAFKPYVRNAETADAIARQAAAALPDSTSMLSAETADSTLR